MSQQQSQQSQQQEYWVNVYNPAPYCYENLNREYFTNRDEALYSAMYIKSLKGFSVSYRIHVKLKLVKSGVIRVTYHKSFDKFNWMDG